MTDSVRCTADSRNSFTCEVHFDAELASATDDATEAARAEPPAVSSPAVESLVSSFVSRTVVPAPPAPLISGPALLKCTSSEASVVLAALAGKGPIIGGLTMLKASFDAASCLTLAHNDAAQRNAEEYCAAQGGVVVGVEGDNTICEVRETVR